MAAPFIPDANAQAIQDQIDTQNQYYASARGNAAQVQQQAASIQAMRLAAPGLPAGTYQSFATAGIDPSGPQFQLIASQYLPRTDTNSVRYSSLTPDEQKQQKALAGVSGGLAGGAAAFKKMSKAQQRAALHPQSDNGWSLNPLDDIGKAHDALSGAADFAVHDIVQPAVRWGSAVVQYPLEVGQNLAGIAAGAPTTAVSDDPRRLGEAFTSGTTLGQDIAHGSGTGWLSTTPDNQAALRHAQVDTRGINAAGGANTLGTEAVDTANLAGQTVFHHQFVDPGSTAYGVVSGLSDLALSIGLDPANLAFSKWKDIAEARKVFDLSPAARQAGLVNSIRNVVNPQRYDTWLKSADGQRVVAQLAKTKNAGEILDRTNYKLPASLAAGLADATTPEEVSTLLREAVGKEFKYVPRVSHFGGLGGLPYGIRTSISPSLGRLLEHMPGYAADPQNIDQAIKNINLYAVEANIPKDVRYGYMDRLARVANSNDPNLVKNTLYGVADQMGGDIEKKLAGDRWFSTLDAHHFGQDLMRSRTSPDFASHVRDALENTFPHATFTQQNVDDIMRLASASGSERTGTPIILDYLSGNLKQTSGDRKLIDALNSGATQSSEDFERASSLLDRSKVLDQANEDGALLDRQGAAALGKSHLTADASRRFATFFRSADGDPARWYDTSQPGGVGHIIVDGHAIPIDGPYAVNEMLDRAVPLPNARRIRQATGALQNLNSVPILKHLAPLTPDGQRRLLGAFADLSTAAWKTSTIALRPATLVRIIANEQLAATTDGAETFFTHPFRNIANAIAGRNPVDLNDEAFAAALADRNSQFAQAAGRSNNVLSDHPDRIFLDQYGPIAATTHDPAIYRQAWGRNLTARASDPLDSQIARALASSADTDEQIAAIEDIKTRFYGGDLDNWRQTLMAGATGEPNDFRPLLAARNGADAYIDGAANRISQLTAGDNELLDLIAHRTFRGKGMEAIGDGKGALSKPFLQKLADLHNQDLGPDMVRGRTSIIDPSQASGVSAKLDRATSWLYDHAITIPSSRLERIPAFKDAYYKEIERLAPSADDAALAKIRDAYSRGDMTNIPTQVPDIKHLTASEIDVLAKNAALDKVHTLMYDAHDRSNFTDMLRVVSPFAEVFRQEVRRWAQIVPTNAPKILRRVGQLQGFVRESHLLAPDPVTGKESLHIPVPGWAQQAAGVLSTGISAATTPFGGQFVNSIGGPTVDADMAIDPSKALFITQGLPGVGAVASIPMDAVLSRIPGGDAIKQTLLPFGATDLKGGVGNAALATFTPTWLKAVEGSQLGANAKRNAAAMADAISYLNASNPQKYQGPAGHAQLIEDATKVAHNLWMVRALGDAFSPATPRVNTYTPTEQGPMELQVLINDWRKTLDGAYANGGTSADATREYLNRFGLSAAMGMTNQTYPLIYGLSSTPQMGAWEQAHPDLVKQYPDVWPFLVPQPGDGHTVDYTTLQRQITDHQRTTLSPTQRLELAEYRVGRYAYDHYRTMVPANPNKAQSQWLAQIRNEIGARFPGYAQNKGQQPSDIPSKADPSYAIGQLQTMANDPALAKNPIAQGITAYLYYRQQALDELGPTATGQSLGNKEAGPLRAWLSAIATQVLHKYPGFAPAWQSFFQPEIGAKVG